MWKAVIEEGSREESESLETGRNQRNQAEEWRTRFIS